MREISFSEALEAKDWSHRSIQVGSEYKEEFVKLRLEYLTPVRVMTWVWENHWCIKKIGRSSEEDEVSRVPFEELVDKNKSRRNKLDDDEKVAEYVDDQILSSSMERERKAAR